MRFCINTIFAYAKRHFAFGLFWLLCSPLFDALLLPFVHASGKKMHSTAQDLYASSSSNAVLFVCQISPQSRQWGSCGICSACCNGVAPKGGTITVLNFFVGVAVEEDGDGIRLATPGSHVEGRPT